MEPVNTPDTAAAVQAAAAYPKTITLPSGLVAIQTRNLKGRDSVAARRITANATEIEMGCALVAQVVQIDGRAVVMEDLLDLDLEDLLDLTEAVTGKLGRSIPRA